jgi:two-component system CheB/CheR fusion protein
MNLLKMAREGLLHGLRDGLKEARKTRTVVSKRELRVRTDGRWTLVNVAIIPLLATNVLHFLVQPTIGRT